MTFSILGTDTTIKQPVYLYRTSRTQGLYIVGLQRMGKSALIENLVTQDIEQGIGVCILDPHGELIDHVIARLPGKAEDKVILDDMKDMLNFFGLPLLDNADLNNELSVERTRSQFLHVFEKAFGITEANPVMYTLLSNIAYTLIANPGYTMIDIRQLLTNKTCREKLLDNKFLLVNKPTVIDFWHSHYDQLSPQRQDEESFFILNKLNDFETAPLRFIVGQSQATLQLQKIMDEGKILLVKLDRQLEQATSLIGSILVALILNASDKRTSKKPFHLYADEFQNFATEDFAVLLEQAGKRNICVAMAHQNRAQLQLSDKQADSQLKARTLNVGSLVVFRVPTDAVTLAQQFDSSPPAPESVSNWQPILTPKADVLTHLREQGHVNSYVQAFSHDYLVPMLRVIETHRRTFYKIRVNVPIEGQPSRKIQISDLNEACNQLNTLFYYVMTDRDAHKPINPFIVYQFGRAFGFAKWLQWAWYWPRWSYWSSRELPSLFIPKDELKLLCAIDYQAHIDVIAVNIPPRVLAAAKDFITSLRNTMEALANQPVMTNGGQHIAILEKPRQFADVQNELSNMLVSLPKYTARVKITDANDRIVEHTILTREPEKGLYGKLLQERIARIQAKQKKPNPYGFTRSKQEIEDEINKRQTQWSGQQQTPQQPRSRGSLVCQSCGAQNSKGSHFCNQCGKQL